MCVLVYTEDFLKKKDEILEFILLRVLVIRHIAHEQKKKRKRPIDWYQIYNNWLNTDKVMKLKNVKSGKNNDMIKVSKVFTTSTV